MRRLFAAILLLLLLVGLPLLLALRMVSGGGDGALARVSRMLPSFPGLGRGPSGAARKGIPSGPAGGGPASGASSSAGPEGTLGALEAGGSDPGSAAYPGAAAPEGPITEEGPVDELSGHPSGESVQYGGSPRRERGESSGRGEEGAAGPGSGGRDADARSKRGSRGTARSSGERAPAYGDGRGAKSGKGAAAAAHPHPRKGDDLGATHQLLKKADRDSSHALRMSGMKELLDGTKDHAGKQFDGNFKVYKGMALQISSGTLNETRIKAIEAPAPGP